MRGWGRGVCVWVSVCVYIYFNIQHCCGGCDQHFQVVAIFIPQSRFSID